MLGLISGAPPSLWFSRAAFYPGSGHCFHSRTLLVLSLEPGDPGEILKQPKAYFVLVGLSLCSKCVRCLSRSVPTALRTCWDCQVGGPPARACPRGGVFRLDPSFSHLLSLQERKGELCTPAPANLAHWPSYRELLSHFTSVTSPCQHSNS